MAMMTCGTIAKLIMDEYGASNLLVNMCALSFLLMFVPGNFMTIYVINRYGFRKCIIIGSVFIVIGCWLRLIMFWVGFGGVIAGQFIAAIG